MNDKCLLCLLIFSLILCSCATKDQYPINRFETAQTHGQTFAGDIGFGKGAVLTGKIQANNTVDQNSLLLAKKSLNAFKTSLGLSESVDFIWTHYQSSPSFFGIKFQFLGAPKSSSAQGHSLAVTAAFAGNKHDKKGDPKIKFELQGADYAFIYGYHFLPSVQAYSSLSYTHYHFSGEVGSGSDPALNGQNFHYTSRNYVGAIGLAAMYQKLEFLVEGAYYKFLTDKSTDQNGFSLGGMVKLHWQ